MGKYKKLAVFKGFGDQLQFTKYHDQGGLRDLLQKAN